MQLVNLTNQSADLCFGANSIFIGPTAVDFSMLDVTQPAPRKELSFHERLHRTRLRSYIFDKSSR